jgi:hypothetical protein
MPGKLSPTSRFAPGRRSEEEAVHGCDPTIADRS